MATRLKGNYALDCTDESNQFSSKLALRPSPEIRPIPYGLVSLSDMINFFLQDFVWAMTILGTMRRKALKEAEKDPSLRISEIDSSGFAFAFSEKIEPVMRAFGVNEAKLIRLQVLFGGTYANLEREISAFEDHIRDDISCEFFYHYPPQRACLLMEIEKHWAATLASFPSGKEDVYSAVDCYALDHNRASIYHSMMILERGLPALAKRLSVPFYPNKATWHDLITKIKTKVDDEIAARAQKSRGSKPPTTKAEITAHKKRGLFLADCQEAAIQFGYFKDIWRNHIAHGRATYDKNDALKCLEHVRDFMQVLAIKIKLKEKPSRGEST